MQKELNVNITLKKWFESFGIKCWLNQGNNKFTTKRLQKKPDIIIYSKLLNQYIAIEVKSGDNNLAIRSGTKILDYWNDYINKKIDYYIDNKLITISSFCFATIGAMNGKIFLIDGFPKDSYNYIKDKWKLTQIKYKLEPRWEYPKSKEYLRQLWANWKRIRGKNQSGVGVILADILNNKTLNPEDIKISHPLLFDMQWRMSFRNKKQWRQKNFKL